MKLLKLQLENFRNHKKYSFSFPEHTNLTILVGENGKGKTNFLESIYIMALGKSFRTVFPDNLITWQNDFLRCLASVDIKDEKLELEVFYSKNPVRRKNFKKNGVNIKNSEYLGNLIAVLFHPEDLNMLYLSPSLRRRYMDIVLSQVDKKYLVALTNYKKVLKQRNALLHRIRDNNFKNIDNSKYLEDLSVWDEELLQFGTVIIQKRLEFTDFLNENLSILYSSISGQKEDVKVEYLNKAEAENFRTDLLGRRNLDIIKAETTLGPHRDDLIFHLNNQKIDGIASRGEFRTLLLSIKLAEIEFIKKKTKKMPILLLDDVFSELDKNRQKHLLMATQGCQTIITTTDLANIDDSAKASAYIEVVEG